MAAPARTEEAPEGLAYREEFVSAEEEQQLLSLMSSIDFAVVMRGLAARRTVRHFGLDYEYESGELAPADPLPEPMLWLRDRCAVLMDRDPGDLVQILISRYPPGAGIGWHRDAPMTGSHIAGVSLRAPCRMRFQRTCDNRQRRGLAVAVSGATARGLARVERHGRQLAGGAP